MALRSLVVATIGGLVACSSKGGGDPATPPVVKTPPCKETAGAFSPLSTRCGHFVDAEGRVVVLRGVNARIAPVFDEDLGPGKVPLEALPTLAPDDMTRMRRLGFDVLRLPVHWSGIEPNDTEPPTYETKYLDEVVKVVEAARSADVRVLLDLHQDAYSKYIGQDGAPLWAIVPAPEKILEGPLEDLGARTLSSQVQKAFGTFFSRTDPAGARLRKRFGLAVGALAKRFVGDRAVIGIELLNEPLGVNDDALRSFDEEIGAAIRAVDPARLVFFEPPATRNLLDTSKLASAPLAMGGTVYAPHVYTHVFTPGDDKWNDTFTIEDLRHSNESAREEADSWGAPLFVGEFGFGPGNPRFADYIGWQLQLQDESMASSTYWLWKEQSSGAWGLFDYDEKTAAWTERPAVRKVFARVVPRAIGGWPQKWKWDAAPARFELAFIGDPAVTAPTILHLPLPEDALANFRVTCDGGTVTTAPDARGDLVVPCGGPGEHRIVVEAK
jgi:endoglycosylceramidase